MPASTKDGATGKNFETQCGRLFVGLERWIDRALEFTQEVETKDHGQESRLGRKKRTQAEVISSQFVLEFVNCGTLHKLDGCNRARFPALHRCDW